MSGSEEFRKGLADWNAKTDKALARFPERRDEFVTGSGAPVLAMCKVGARTVTGTGPALAPEPSALAMVALFSRVVLSARLAGTPTVISTVPPALAPTVPRSQPI